MDRLRATFDVLKMSLSPSFIHKTTFFSTVSKSKCVATPKKNRKIWRKSKVKMVSCTRHVCCRLVETINFNSKLNRSVLRKKIFFIFAFLRITNKKSQYSWFEDLFLFCGLWNWTTGQVRSMEHSKTGWGVVRWWALWLANGGKKLVEVGKTWKTVKNDLRRSGLKSIHFVKSIFLLFFTSIVLYKHCNIIP